MFNADKLENTEKGKVLREPLLTFGISKCMCVHVLVCINYSSVSLLLYNTFHANEYELYHS